LNTPDNGYQHLLSNEDQQFVYETAGSLIVTSNFDPEVRAMLARAVKISICDCYKPKIIESTGLVIQR